MECLELDNGVRLIFLPLPNTKHAIIRVGFAVGAAHDPADKQGLAHFNEHLVWRNEQANTIEQAGTITNGYTSYDTTMFLIECQKRYIVHTLNYMLSTLTNYDITDGIVDKERQVILNELHLHKDSPEWVRELAINVLYRDTPFAHSILGDENTLAGITATDLIMHKRAYYMPTNMAVVIAGDVERDLKSKCVNLLSSLQGHSGPTSMYIDITNRHYEHIVHTNYTLAYTHIAYKVLGLSHADKYPLAIASVIIGGGYNSFLFKLLRQQKGVCYDVGTDLILWRDCGAFDMYVHGYTSDNYKTVKRALRRALNILVEGKFTSAEFERAKNIVIQSTLTERCSPQVRATQAAIYTLYNVANEPDHHFLRKIKHIKKQDVVDIARKYFSEHYTEVTLLPKKT